MAKIHIMDEILSNKIAAGEVVEKCVSVVKELVENSIDAHSTEIKIELIEAGTKQIKVVDNGTGMDEDDALTAFQRHATSKLLDEDDLYRINTLGFRGEALPSIASVSMITLKTCVDNIGTMITINGGKIEKQEKCEARKGTSIEVNKLFYNTPARLKHLNSLNSELSNIIDYINKIALSYPNIKFTLSNNDKVILNTAGDGNLLKVINSIYGIEVAKNMIEVNTSNDDYEINGYISKPIISRANRNHIITLVNGRVVKNNELNKTIVDSYHTYIMEGKFPIVVLNINVDSSLIDVNIHPTKMDIKFSKMDGLKDIISEVINKSLNSTNLIQTIENPKPIISYEQPKVVVQQELELERVEYPKEEIKPLIVEESKNEEYNNEKIEVEKIPELYVCGSVFGTYIVCQNNIGMYLIDQHAAKERINYELYLYKLSNPDNNIIDMLFPITIELPLNEFIIIKEHIDLLKNMNINIEEFGMSSFIIKSHPIWLPKGNEEVAIRKIIDLILTIKTNFSLEKFNDKVAATLACKASIKANDALSIEEMENLIDDLRKCNNPYNCPHGRPTIINFTKYELEKMFKRAI
ncbi:MAG: DNA mismatch repair endonuclease MutL [Bacilli bacterium]|nr:DNA mismatch repair endonuclease MutL [Bacilli bacterium]